MNRILPKLFRWVFTLLAVLMALAACVVLVAIVVDPALPPDARFGPINAEFMGHPATLALQPAADGQGEPVLSAHAFNGNVTMTVDKPAGAIELLKSNGLPLLLIYAVFFAALFELLRRLFRNVGRGESFTPQSVRLVQIVGGSLIVFSLVAAIGETWFAHAMYGYLVDHTQVSISGTPVRLPPGDNSPVIGRVPFRSSAFYSGLLVLALAEVFRQGLALQRDNELTV
jgi:hypothetical protein